jgi:hypothetical protein
LELLFNDYDQKRCEKYHKAIVRIFDKDVFFKEDFRNITNRNKYFVSYLNIENSALDRVKDNVRKYSENYLSRCKKANKNNKEDLIALFRAFEICAPYLGAMPDYTNAVNLYRKLQKSSGRKFEEIHEWIDCRISLLEFLDNAQLQKASFTDLTNRLKSSRISVTTLSKSLSREDSAGFIAAAFQKDDYAFDKAYIASSLIYKHYIRRDDFRPFNVSTVTMANKIANAVGNALNELLSNKTHVDEYKVKILSFTWEALFDHPEVAKNYNDLSKKARLSRVTILKEYLQKRALLHYSYGKINIFEKKQEEYNITMTKDYLPTRYPIIKEKEPAGNVLPQGTAIQDRSILQHNTSTIKKPNKKEIENEASKQTAKEIALKMKQQGMSIDVIKFCVPQLTIQEIEEL